LKIEAIRKWAFGQDERGLDAARRVPVALEMVMAMNETRGMVRLLLGLILWLGAASLSAEAIAVLVGEQPPLFSKNGGIVDQVVDRALRLGGWEPTFEWLPIGRMLATLEEDKASVYVTPSNTAGQQNPHVFLLSAQGVFFYKKSHMGNVSITRLEDLAGRRVGTVTNSPLRPLFEKAGIIVDEGPFETMFDKLEAGRVDFTSTADVGGILTIRAKYPGRESEFDFTDFSYTEIKAGLFVQDRPDLRKVLAACETGFARMKEDGSLTKLLKAFFGPEYYRRVRVF
jgi:ABC-type amino acid transport substrate-binding protein